MHNRFGLSSQCDLKCVLGNHSDDLITQCLPQNIFDCLSLFHSNNKHFDTVNKKQNIFSNKRTKFKLLTLCQWGSFIMIVDQEGVGLNTHYHFISLTLVILKSQSGYSVVLILDTARIKHRNCLNFKI